MCPMVLAAKEGHYETVKYLIEAGVSTVKKDKFKRTAAVIALRNGYSRVAALLLKHGCPWNQPDSSDNYPLHYACGYGAHQAIDILMKAGANINQYNSWKLTPIGIAMLKNHTRAIKSMLGYPGIDTNCKDDKGRSLVSNVLRILSEDNYNLATRLITQHGSDLLLADLEGMIPLHHLVNSIGLDNKFYQNLMNKRRIEVVYPGKGKTVETMTMPSP